MGRTGVNSDQHVCGPYYAACSRSSGSRLAAGSSERRRRKLFTPHGSPGRRSGKARRSPATQHVNPIIGRSSAADAHSIRHRQSAQVMSHAAGRLCLPAATTSTCASPPVAGASARHLKLLRSRSMKQGGVCRVLSHWLIGSLPSAERNKSSFVGGRLETSRK